MTKILLISAAVIGFILVRKSRRAGQQQETPKAAVPETKGGQ